MLERPGRSSAPDLVGLGRSSCGYAHWCERNAFANHKARLLGRTGHLCLGIAALVAGLTLGTVQAQAQNATWLLNPGTGNFNTDANWTPATVPTGTAFFGASNTTALSFSANTTVGGWTFNAGAPAYTFTTSNLLDFNGAGIVING